MLNQRKETAPDGDLPGIYGKLFALYDGKHLQLVLSQEVGPFGVSPMPKVGGLKKVISSEEAGLAPCCALGSGGQRVLLPAQDEPAHVHRSHRAHPAGRCCSQS